MPQATQKVMAATYCAAFLSIAGEAYAENLFIEPTEEDNIDRALSSQGLVYSGIEGLGHGIGASKSTLFGRTQILGLTVPFVESAREFGTGNYEKSVGKATAGVASLVTVPLGSGIGGTGGALVGSIAGPGGTVVGGVVGSVGGATGGQIVAGNIGDTVTNKLLSYTNPSDLGYRLSLAGIDPEKSLRNGQSELEILRELAAFEYQSRLKNSGIPVPDFGLEDKISALEEKEKRADGQPGNSDKECQNEFPEIGQMDSAAGTSYCAQERKIAEQCLAEAPESASMEPAARKKFCDELLSIDRECLAMYPQAALMEPFERVKFCLNKSEIAKACSKIAAGEEVEKPERLMDKTQRNDYISAVGRSNRIRKEIENMPECLKRYGRLGQAICEPERIPELETEMMDLRMEGQRIKEAFLQNMCGSS